MKKSFAVLFLFLVFLPMCLLGWMGLRLLEQEQIVQDHQALQLSKARLISLRTLITNYFSSLEQDSVDALSFINAGDGIDSTEVELIRGLIDTDPYLEQIFVLNAERELLFPVTSFELSNKEKKFLSNSENMFANERLFREINLPEQIDGSKQTASESYPSLLKSVQRSNSRLQSSLEVAESVGVADQVSAARITGWSTWDVGASTEVYFWFKDASGNIIGQRLSSAYWQAQLISQFPDDSNTRGVAMENGAVRLLDKRQRTVYQWGGRTISENEQAFTTSALVQPLDGWSLEYYTESRDSFGIAEKILFGLLLIVFLLVMLSLAWFVWRSYRRELHTAEQRVSFVNQVSHELKTPLTNICMYADLLEEEVIDNQHPDQNRVRKFSDVLTAESQRLGRLINNVLNFSKSQIDQITINRAPFVVDEVVRKCIKTFEAAFAASDISFELELDAFSTVQLDPDVLEQVLNNLLSNIEKYAASGRIAKIMTRLEGDSAHIEVSDAGSGIPKKLQAELFKPFTRGSNAINEGASGTGIGLSIAQSLCRLHGGDLRLKVSSSSGSTFEVSIDVSAAEGK